MSLETAYQTANFVKEHCNGAKVHFCWFGGEPLVNQKAIEIICNDLRENGNEFESLVISNGYLFDEETVNKAVKEWNLNRVQITLDGTEKIYNKAKAYIYREGNPYQIVLENIGHLLDAGVYVMIRLNMDLYNAEDLTKLVEQLGERFFGRKGLHIYAYHLFKGNEPMASLHTEEEWEKRDQAMIRLEETIQRCGFAGKKGIGKSIKLNNCKADSGKAVTVMPDGSVGLCDHISNEAIGHVAQKELSLSIMESYKERITEIPECSECFYYPECTKIKKCASESVCFEQIRNMHLRIIKRQMLNEYEKWKTQQASEDMEEDELC
jgi:radical SAM protein with 4Fe4S-binding SPASM domain